MISRLYGMWMGLQQNQENRARQNLMSFLSMYPNATDDQKRAAIQQYQTETAHLNPSMRMTFPTEAIPGPVTQAATPGVAPEAPGTAQNAPVGPSGGAPLVPGGPSVTGGVLREEPGWSGIAPTPEVRGPSPGTEIAVPRSDPLQQTGADNPAWDSFLQQNASPSIYQTLRNMTMQEVFATNPMIRSRWIMASQSGGQPQAPGGMVPGQPGAPAGMQVGQGQPQAQSGVAPSVVGMGMTWGQVFPQLASNPIYKDIMGQQIPEDYFNPNTGQFDRTQALGFLNQMNQSDLEHRRLSDEEKYRTDLERDRAQTAITSRVHAIIVEAQNAARAGAGQAQIHNLLQKARDLIQQYGDKYDLSGAEAEISGNTSDQMVQQGQLRRAQVAKAEAPPRQPAGRAPRGSRSSGGGGRAPRQPRQPRATGGKTPNKHQGSSQVATVNAQIQGLWNQIFSTFQDKKVTDAIHRVEYGQVQPGDQALLMGAKTPSGQTAWAVASRLANLQGQLKSRKASEGPDASDPAGIR